MSMGRPGGGGRGGRVSAADADAQRELNRQAPAVPDLGARIVGLFRPYRPQLVVIAALVLVAAALSVIPPLITQRVFDDALFPGTGTRSWGCSPGSWSA